MVHPLRYNNNVTDVIDERSVRIDVIVEEVSSNCRNINNFRRRMENRKKLFCNMINGLFK